MVEAAAVPARRLGVRSPKLLIGGLIIVLALAYLVYAAAQGSTAYYLTVGEAKAQGPSSRMIRIAGTIRGDTIVWNPGELLLKFEISDESGVLPVTYHGPRPDMLQDGTTAVLEGRYTPAGVLEARTILLKCPSKYEGAQ